MRRVRLIGILIASAVMLWLLTACTVLPAAPNADDDAMEMDMSATDGSMSMDAQGGMEMPADLDMSTTRTSEFGLFTVSYTADQEPIPFNEMHRWTLHVETADGVPVETATIAVDGGMPQHDHGLPTAPEVTENLGGGDYRLEGVKFQMNGWWEIKVVIDDGEDQDEITFNLMVK